MVHFLGSRVAFILNMNSTVLLFSLSCAVSASIPFFLLPQQCATEECKKFESPHSPNPCGNFYKYACDRWIRENPKPPSEVVWNHWQSVSHRIRNRVHSILTSTEPIDFSPLLKAKLMYMVCVNQEPDESRSLLISRKLVESFGTWPLVNEHRVHDEKLEWLHMVAKVTRTLNVYPLLKMNVDVDFTNTSRYALYIRQGDLVLPRHILLEPVKNVHHISAYKKWVSSTIRHLYDEETLRVDLEQSVLQLIQFEIDLVELTSKETSLEKLRIGDLPTDGRVNWMQAFRELFRDTNVELNEKDYVFYVDGYVQRLISYVNDKDSKTVANYIVWCAIRSISRDVTSHTRALNFEIDKSILKVQADVPRRQECLSNVIEHFSPAVIKKYIKKHVNSNTNSYITHMAQNIKLEFVRRLQNVTWMNKNTKRNVLEKIKRLRFVLGSPDWMLRSEAVEKMFEDVNITSDNLINVLKLRKSKVRANLRLFGSSVSKNRWPCSPFEVNAFYSILQNAVFIPFGLMELPFFHIQKQAAFNYGALGSLIGHEISHSLDTKGRLADKEGRIRTWWKSTDVKHYNERILCFANKYHESDTSGSYTLSENIADNLGVQLSFEALKRNEKHARVHARQQLFFVSYAQMWCEVPIDSEILKDDEHDPVEHRVASVMNNTNALQSYFGCSTVNQNRCVLF